MTIERDIVKKEKNFIDLASFDIRINRTRPSARYQIIEQLKKGQVLTPQDIVYYLSSDDPKQRSSQPITEAMMRRRFPDKINPMAIGRGRYRGRRFYFDASLEPEQIGFGGVIRKIDIKKGPVTPKQ